MPNIKDKIKVGKKIDPEEFIIDTNLKEKGDYLIVSVKGLMGKFLAEVVETAPMMTVKITETGPLSDLEITLNECKINKPCSLRIQNGKTDFLKFQKCYSGLKSFGIKDGQLHRIHPRDE